MPISYTASMSEVTPDPWFDLSSRPFRRKTFSLLGLLWATTIVAMFLSAWNYLPVASNVSRFWYSWSIVMLEIAAIGLVIRAWRYFRPPSVSRPISENPI
jgi:hypothetical protein